MAARTITSKDINALTGRTCPATDASGSSALALLRQLWSWYAEKRRYLETVAELERLSDHLLADIGIGRHEIREVARASSRKA